MSDDPREAKPSGGAADGYYGLPMLKEPVWGWEIAWYFLLEGISAGAFLLAAMARLAGDERDADTVAAGDYIALAALIPCPPLLIADLGRPERFHHMLRVFKPSSPMNTGAWALAAYSLPVGLLALKQWTGAASPGSSSALTRTSRLLPAAPIALAGLPIALTMISYPGVLLSTTSTPVWARTRLLGALLACSSMSAAAATLSFVLAVRGRRAARSLRRLHRIEQVAAAAETATLAGYLLSSGDAAAPLTTGRGTRLFWGGAVAVGLVGGTFARALASRRGRYRRPATIAGAVCTVAGGWALKRAVVYAGRESARDPAAARSAARATPAAPGWVPAP